MRKAGRDRLAGRAKRGACEAAAALDEILSPNRRPLNLNFFCHVPAAPDPILEARWLADPGCDAVIAMGSKPAAIAAASWTPTWRGRQLTMLLTERTLARFGPASQS